MSKTVMNTYLVKSVENSIEDMLALFSGALFFKPNLHLEVGEGAGEDDETLAEDRSMLLLALVQHQGVAQEVAQKLHYLLVRVEVLVNNEP